MITFDEAFTIETLREAYYIVRRGKKFREISIRYHMNLHKNLVHLLNRLKSGKYYLDRVSTFKVYEPKERDVIADFFEDKIVQDVLCKRVLRVILMPRFIHDNYASQPGKGTHHGVQRIQHFMMSHVNQQNFSNDGWVVAGDIAKFFYSIDHTICKQMIGSLLIDELLRKLLYIQIDACTAVLNPYVDDDADDIGLCIGFQCSQWLSNMYLDPLDHFVKEKLRVKYYGRYADDFLLICNTKNEASHALKEINTFVRDSLSLKLNKKSYIHPFNQGICFLGYHMWYNPATHGIDMHIRSKSIARMERRTKVLMKLVRSGELSIQSAISSVESWYSYAKHGETAKVLYAYLWAKMKLMEANEEYQFHHQVDLAHTTEDPMGLVDEEGFYMLIRRTEPYIEEGDKSLELAYDNYMAMQLFYDKKRYEAFKASRKQQGGLNRIRHAI
ncbi:MAG: reverse transcriptase/maturase family protein [Ruminococcus flavefaciens]|nr:reverse transcriptase/maturase family protein [Ruminococcus flavefaciens]